MRRINQAGLELIKKFEGLVLNAYKCPAGLWTIGYGHTATAEKGQVINREQAELLLYRDLRLFEKAVNDLVKVKLNDNQFSALVSLCFNIGIGAFSRSTLLKRLNGGFYKLVPAEMARWNKIGGVLSVGLTRRRMAEADLWRKIDGPNN